MICQRWSHRTEEGKLLNWLEIRRALKALMFWHFLLSSPQCAFLTGDQLRNSEWWQSAARGEYTPLPFSSYSFTEWPRILIWISSGAQLHVCEGMQYLHSPVMSCPTLQAPSPGACLISFDFAGGRGGELSLRFSSTVTLSIGSTGCNFSILLAEIPVSLWSSLPGPENDTDAREVFEVRNCRSSSAIIEQFELWSLARGAALFLLFLRYVQTPELLLVECFSKCWSACVRHVMLGLICVCFWVCVVRAGGPRIHRMSTSCQWIVGQQHCSCPASDKEQLSSQKLFGPCKWVLWTSELFFCPKSDF